MKSKHGTFLRPDLPPGLLLLFLFFLSDPEDNDLDLDLVRDPSLPRPLVGLRDPCLLGVAGAALSGV